MHTRLLCCVVSVFVLMLSASCGSAQDKPEKVGNLKWLATLADAQKAAAESKKPIMALFTGSDWCPWCVKLEKEVISTAEFQTWAEQNVVLVKFDLLRRSPMTPAATKELKDNANKYKVEGYPTVVFLSAKGEELGRTGYVRGGPGPWLKAAAEALAAKK